MLSKEVAIMTDNKINKIKTMRDILTDAEKKAFVESMDRVYKVNPVAFHMVVPATVDIFEWYGFEAELVEQIALAIESKQQ